MAVLCTHFKMQMHKQSFLKGKPREREKWVGVGLRDTITISSSSTPDPSTSWILAFIQQISFSDCLSQKENVGWATTVNVTLSTQLHLSHLCISPDLDIYVADVQHLFSEWLGVGFGDGNSAEQ